MITRTINHERVLTAASAIQSHARVLYLDSLRILLTTLVILLHLAIGYGAAGDWYYNEDGPIAMPSTILLTMFNAVNQAFFMGMFFMLASYLTPSSYERKGARSYLADRLKRLGIPILVYALVIQPLFVYVLRWHNVENPFARPPAFGVGPMWFVETLLLFSLAYAAWRLIIPTRAVVENASHARAPGNAVIALFALALGLATFVWRIWFPVGWWFEPLHLQLAHFPQYIALLALGLVAYQRNWFAALSTRQGKLWLLLALALVPTFFVIGAAGGALEGNIAPFMGGLTWQSLAFSVWEQLMCAAMIISLLVLFRQRFNHQGARAKTLSGDAYAVYFIHAPVIVLLALALSGIQIEMGLKFLFVAPVAVALSFLVGHYVRKLPLARDVL